MKCIGRGFATFGEPDASLMTLSPETAILVRACKIDLWHIEIRRNKIWIVLQRCRAAGLGFGSKLDNKARSPSLVPGECPQGVLEFRVPGLPHSLDALADELRAVAHSRSGLSSHARVSIASTMNSDQSLQEVASSATPLRPNGIAIVSICMGAVFLSLSIVSVVLRIYCRLWKRRSLKAWGWDDLLAVLGLVRLSARQMSHELHITPG